MLRTSDRPHNFEKKNFVKKNVKCNWNRARHNKTLWRALHCFSQWICVIKIGNLTQCISKASACISPSSRIYRISCMMTSSNGNIFRVIGPLCGEFTGHRCIPSTKTSDAGLWSFLWLCQNKRLSNQSRGWRFETPSYSLWRHCNGSGQLERPGGIYIYLHVLHMASSPKVFYWYIYHDFAVRKLPPSCSKVCASNSHRWCRTVFKF